MTAYDRPPYAAPGADQPGSRIQRHAWDIALFVTLVLIGCYLFQRNHGLFPNVFADEWYYSKMARLEPFGDALVPSWLFLWLTRALSSAAGAHFLEAVRLLNLGLLLAAAPLLYATTRRFASPALAYAIAVAATLAPLNLYSAYFMPETTYYFGFCLLAWVALTRGGWHWAMHAAAVGVVLGLMSLLKVHALFLLPGLCLFLAYAAWAGSAGALRNWIGPALGAPAVAATSTLGTKFSLGWLIAGDAGLHLFGRFYGAAADTATRSAFDLLAPTLTSATGHLATLALLAGLPLAILAHVVLTRVPRRHGAQDAGQGALGKLALYTLLMFGAACGLAVLYTASLNFMGPSELTRLHLRYYSFTFPLLWLMAAAAVRGDDGRAPWLRWSLALAGCALLLLAMTVLPSYRFLMVDGPDIATIDLAHPGARALALAQAGLLLAWAARLRAAPLLFVVAILPATLVAGQVGVSEELRTQGAASPADLGGQAVRRHVPAAELSSLVVAGENAQFLMRAQFQIDHPQTQTMVLPYGGPPISQEQMPATARWLLLIAHTPMPDAVAVEEGAGYRLIRLRDVAGRMHGRVIGQATLGEGFQPGLLAAVDGFSHGEPWGRWSIGKQVTLHFSQPLPRKAGLVLEGQSFGVNATLPFIARAGDASVEFRIGGAAHEVGLHLTTDGTVRSVVIEVPQPQSPAELGNPADARPLGIGLRRVTLVDLEQNPS